MSTNQNESNYNYKRNLILKRFFNKHSKEIDIIADIDPLLEWYGHVFKQFKQYNYGLS